MNNDLISREALKKKLQARHDNGEEDFDKGYNIGIETAIDLIDNAPTIYPICEDKACKYRANEKPNGEWLYLKANEKQTDGYKCSICKITYHTRVSYFSEFNFCPNCGASMKGGATNDT